MDCADCELFPTLTMLSLSVKGVYPFSIGLKSAGPIVRKLL